MKIISWNVNGIRACYKKNLMDFLQHEKPDIFCVQETKAHIDQVELGTRTLMRNHSYWSSAIRKGYSGVATFVNQEPARIELGIGIPEYDSEGRIVITDHGAFDLYNIYFPNGGSGELRHQFKQKFLKELNVHLKEKLATGRQVVVVGDYNVAHEAIDVHDPIGLSRESGFLPEERAWMDSFLDLGFIDTFRYFKPKEANRFSWWDNRTRARLTNRGWRIDYVCISKGLEKYLSSADILDKVEGSDHCPVVATLDL